MSSNSTFSVPPIERFAGKSAPLKRPQEITYFSYDKDRNFHWDDSSLQYYYTPSLPADLSHGYETFRRWDDSIDEHLVGLLKALMLHEQQAKSICTPDVLTWRGMMTKIMAAPFDQYSEFEMNATLFQGTIFIEEHHPGRYAEKQQQNSRKASDRHGPSQDMMAFWGYKFEALALIPDVWDKVSREYIDTRDEHVVDNMQQYCSIVDTKIGETSLILGGEVDAVWDQKPNDQTEPINWVELKTSQEILSDWDHDKFERKLLRIWIQSFLIGVPRVIVGFRSKKGELLRLQEYMTQSIPGYVKRHKASWNGNSCVNFAASFLAFLKQTINTEGTWRIQRRKNSPDITITKMDEHGTGDILSADFLHWRQQAMAEDVAKMLG